MDQFDILKLPFRRDYQSLMPFLLKYPLILFLAEEVYAILIHSYDGVDPEFVLKRELCLVKVKTGNEKARSEVIQYADIFRAKIIDVCDDNLTIELTGNTTKIDPFIRLLKPFGIKKIARTGPTAVARGHH